MRHLPARAPADAREALRRGRDDGCDELVLMRGEVTLREDLPALVREARRLGFGLVQIQTDGRRLAYGRVARALARAGVTHVEGLLYAADAATHDALARVEGAFDQSVAGLARAVEAGLAVQAQLLLARPALAGAAALPGRLAALGVSRLQLAFPRPIPGPDGRLSPLVPTLAEAVAAVRAAAPACARAGIALTTEGLPFCVLGDLAPLAADAWPDRAPVVIDDLHRRVRGLGPLRAAYRPWAPACGPCAAREACPTTWGAWLARHGDAELAPLPPPWPPPPP